jgi:hypothetical protein
MVCLTRWKNSVPRICPRVWTKLEKEYLCMVQQIRLWMRIKTQGC